jgi:hypothetical protein
MAIRINLLKRTGRKPAADGADVTPAAEPIAAAADADAAAEIKASRFAGAKAALSDAWSATAKRGAAIGRGTGKVLKFTFVEAPAAVLKTVFVDIPVGIAKPIKAVAYDLPKKAVTGAWEKSAGYRNATGEAASWLTYKPAKAVWEFGRDKVFTRGGAVAAVGLAAGAAALGYESWKDKRGQGSDVEEGEAAVVLNQNIAANNNRLAALANERRAAIESVANQDVPADKVTKLEASKQQVQPATTLAV